MRHLFIVMALAGLAACASSAAPVASDALAPPPPAAAPAPPPPAAIVGSATFLCDDGLRMSAQFQDRPAQVRLTMTDNTTLLLPRQASGSGFRYSDGDYSLSGKGVSATFEAPGRNPAICTDVTESK